MARTKHRAARAERNRLLAICMLASALILVLITAYATDLLDSAKVDNYPMNYRESIEKYSAEYSLDPALVSAIIYTESHFSPTAVSEDGARGLMQIMPETGEWLAGKIDLKSFTAEMLYDPDVSIHMGCWYLNYLFNRFSGDSKKTLAAYNAGQNAVDGWLAREDCSSDGVTLDRIPAGETSHYVKKVKAAHDIYLDRYFK